MSFKGRLRRAEASVRGLYCPGCGLRPRDKGYIVVEGEVEGKDPAPPGLPEVCPECGRSTRIRIVVVEEEEADEGGGG